MNHWALRNLRIAEALRLATDIHITKHYGMSSKQRALLQSIHNELWDYYNTPAGIDDHYVTCLWGKGAVRDLDPCICRTPGMKMLQLHTLISEVQNIPSDRNLEQRSTGQPEKRFYPAMRPDGMRIMLNPKHNKDLVIISRGYARPAVQIWKNNQLRDEFDFASIVHFLRKKHHVMITKFFSDEDPETRKGIPLLYCDLTLYSFGKNKKRYALFQGEPDYSVMRCPTELASTPRYVSFGLTAWKTILLSKFLILRALLTLRYPKADDVTDELLYKELTGLVTKTKL